MTKKIPTGWTLGCGLLFALSAQAATLEEDEARIEALLQAEHAAAVRSDMSTIAVAVPDTPAPVVAEVVAPPADAVTNEDWLAPAPARDSDLQFADLAQHVGGRVSIVTAGERVHRGTIVAANARQVILQVRQPGGHASYTLRREQVVRIDAR
ncbi:hypothetical protein [Dokdonella soli]|uniref:Type IV pilus biogenesis protein PilP n=1 Tax=Dokdonella soli TaxID=529810 RepID=A0ABN1ILA6_9GAMM